MAHTYVSSLYHCVWSTKDRRNQIFAELEPKLWAYLGGIARANRMKTLAVGGIANHVHVLISLPATRTLASAIQALKGGSSKWIHDEFPAARDFTWQEGYGAFSIGASQIDDTVKYIDNQKRHHRAMKYEDELRAFLKKNGIEWNERQFLG